MAFEVNVPNVVGVPAVLRSSSIISAATGLLGADAYGLLTGLFGLPQWGLYYLFLPVVVADTVAVFDLHKSWSISDFPVERGQFESYNKVYQPFRGTVRFATGGSQFDRQLLLASVEAIAGDTNIYTLVTPEAIYPSVNVVDYSYRRSANAGMGLITIDVQVEEVRQSTVVTYASTQNAESAPQLNNGPTQGTTLTPPPPDEVITSSVLPAPVT